MTEAIDKPNPPLMRMFNLRRGLDEPEVIDATIREGVTIFGTNLWVLLLAMLIASIGLDVNSTAVIIGAMLISPLMGPIVGVGYGLAIGDLVLIRKGTLTLLAFTAVSLLSSTAYFTLSPLSEPGSELLARTSPTLWDVLIAFFGGAAGIIALTRRSFSNVLPGVAIATALMPPLCTTGYSIANGHWGWAAGAFYLFTINGVFIAFATLLFVKLIGLPERADVPPATGGKAKILTALTVIAVALPSTWLAWEGVRAQSFNRELGAAIDAAARLADVVILKRDVRYDTRRVDLTVAGDGHVDEIERQLEASIAASPELAGTVVSVRSVSGPQIDVGSIRGAFQADLSRAVSQHEASLRQQLQSQQKLLDEQRQQLAALAVRESELKKIRSELRALYPTLVTADLGLSQTDEPNQPHVVISLSAQPPLPQADRARLERWFKIRLSDLDVSVHHAVAPPAQVRR